MKLLLTSSGITNDALARELEKLVGKPFNELVIGFIPTAAFAECGPKEWLIRDLQRLQSRGAKIHIISLADLTNEEIERRLEAVEVIFVGGGNVFYLSYMFQAKGLFEKLPKMLETKVFVGISAGSMIVTASLRTTSQAILDEPKSIEQYEKLGPKGFSSAKTMQLVPFAIRPHLGVHLVDEINGGVLERIVSEYQVSVYAIDDDCAVRVVDEEYTIVGGGKAMIVKPS